MRRCTPCPCWILLQPCWVNRLVGIPYSSTVWGTFTILLFELCSHSSRFDHSVCINHTVFVSFVRAWGREGGREGCFHWGHICICLNECRFFMFLMHFRAKFDRDYIYRLCHTMVQWNACATSGCTNCQSNWNMIGYEQWASYMQLVLLSISIIILL